MARVLSALETYARDEVRKFPPHRLCGGATLSVGLISGGLSVNTVPDFATIDIDRRLLPGEAWEDAYGDVVEYLRRTLGPEFPVEHERPFPPGPALADDDNGPLAELLGGVARDVAGRGAAIGVPFGTDASKTAQAGVPSVVFGPGSIAQAHTADEWLPLDELEQASEILYRFLLAAA
jgi:acetylornithine deacetylase